MQNFICDGYEWYFLMNAHMQYVINDNKIMKYNQGFKVKKYIRELYKAFNTYMQHTRY